MKVRICFSGLCGFVPGDLSDNPGWMGVFLVDADERSRRDFGLALRPHYPFIRFKWQDLEGLSDVPADEEDHAYWALQDKDVVFLTGNAPTGVHINRKNGPIGETPGDDPVEKAYFDWVSSIDAVEPGAGKVHSDCFLRVPGRRVSVRIHLNEGTLKTDEVGEFEGDFVLSQFDPPNEDNPVPRRTFALRTVLEMEAVEGNFIVRGLKFGGSAPGQLVFKDLGQEGVLELSVLNTCMDDIVKDDNKIVDYPSVDKDFRWFYVMSAPPIGDNPSDPDLPVPVPVRFSISSRAGGGEPAQCTNTLFKPPERLDDSIFMVNLAGALREA